MTKAVGQHLDGEQRVGEQGVRAAEADLVGRAAVRDHTAHNRQMVPPPGAATARSGCAWAARLFNADAGPLRREQSLLLLLLLPRAESRRMLSRAGVQSGRARAPRGASLTLSRLRSSFFRARSASAAACSSGVFSLPRPRATMLA